MGSLLPLSIWKTFGVIYWWVPFVASPVFSLAGTFLMVGYVDFKESIKGSAFWTVLAVMQLLGILLSLGVVLD